ncbi:DNA-directed RNA polymerase I subunit RPA34.5-domain-containing protein [Apodospora peruviana]|uniref:DNA-directed RNA polymerase I subunit RPA34.5-domain-containing protein n=1 Tax=Apodospora peruviana TaxID=516989 RepID=A0AAE0IC54_9PEZI|nr:DNA-directed RNA polymerase I subunit RPA34.5-domain-containing protein [Apodospora peruviana]
MAGPRAPIGTLSQHSENAAKLVRNNTPASRASQSKRAAKKADESSDSDSDSSSGGSDSDSSDSEAVEKKTDWAANLRAVAPKSTPNGSKTAKTFSLPPSSNPNSKDKMDIDKVPKKTVKASSSASDSSSSESESDSDSSDKSDSSSGGDNKRKATKKATSAPKSGQNMASKSSTSNSSDSDESDAGAKVSQKSKPTKAEESSSESDESSSESESEMEVKRVKKGKEIPKVKQPAKLKSTSSAGPAKVSSKSNEMAIDSDSGSDEETSESMAIEKNNGTVQKVPEIISPGFHLLRAEKSMDASEVTRIFQDAHKAGKQIWYFTAPASIPIEVIQKHAIPLAKVQSGQAIFSHNGDDYNAMFEEASVSHSIKVIIPSNKLGQFETSKRPIDQALHLKKVTRFAQGGIINQPAPAITAKAPRPQPKGLKARFAPIGASDAPMGKIGASENSESDEDVEMSQVPLLLPSSGSVETPGTKTKKRKHAAAEKPGAETPASSKKSKKKARVDALGTPAAGTQDSASKKAAKETPIASPIPVNGESSSQVPNSSQPKTINGVKSALKKETPILPPSIPGMRSS